VIPDYENKDVLEIIRKLGPYDYGKISDDGVQREKRSMQLLENKTRYEG